jgi:cellobiose-specific phosphotransferase system component IIC
MARKRKNKTWLGTIGIILVIFGITGTIPIILNKEYIIPGLSATSIAIVIGVILISFALSD